jgi:hypothetical protein
MNESVLALADPFRCALHLRFEDIVRHFAQKFQGGRHLRLSLFSLFSLTMSNPIRSLERLK